MITITNELIDPFVKEESLSQNIMDSWYTEKSWTFDRNGACRDYDLTINGATVEEKFIYNDCGNILIEIIQDVISLNKGWFYYTNAQRVFFVVTHRFLYSVDWKRFKEWFIGEMKKGTWFKPVISAKGYGYTINLAVNRSEIPNDLYKYFEII